MRKIESLMNAAVSNNKNWTNSNTSVTYCPESEESKVYLHGNHIATVGDNFLQIFDGGWQSNTTKSRLPVTVEDFVSASDGGRAFEHGHVDA